MRIAATTLGLFLVAGTGAALASEDHQLIVNEEQVEFSQGLWVIDDWTYVPVREFSEKMGWLLGYDEETRLITVSNEIGDKLSFTTGSPKIEYNGGSYEISGPVKSKDGNAFFPLRLLAEAMHASVDWEEEDKLSIIKSEQEYVVADGDTLTGIAAAHETTVKLLKLRNGLAGDTLEVGQRLKVIVPGFLEPAPKVAAVKKEAEPEVNQADLTLLAKLVQAEAGGEPYAGKLAVASVVMNRLKAGYADTVKGVIYAPYQFSPARNGKLEKMTPSKDSVKAAKAALLGENNVPGAVYFFNPKMEPAKLKKVKVVAKIGNHVFAKPK